MPFGLGAGRKGGASSAGVFNSKRLSVYSEAILGHGGEEITGRSGARQPMLDLGQFEFEEVAAGDDLASAQRIGSA